MTPLKRLASLALISFVSCAAGAARTAHLTAKPTTAVMVPAAAMKWTQQTPGLPIEIVTLWGSRDTGPFGELVKLPAGFESKLHAHTGDYRGVLIAGTWIHIEDGGVGADRELGPGSYVLQPGRGMHIDKCKAGAECILFIYQTEKPDILWPSNQ